MSPRFDLHPDRSLLLHIDVQEKFTKAIPAIAEGGAVGAACQLLLQGCQLLQVPVVFSEQYPEKLSSTIPYLAQLAPQAETFAKTHFSCADDPAIRDYLADSQRDQIIIAGIEAHICVLATVDDLRTRGYDVVVAADAIDSRNPTHREHALATMRQRGALVVPTESILFRLQRQAGIGCFKEISKLVR